jgi:hypothetical protein
MLFAALALSLGLSTSHVSAGRAPAAEYAADDLGEFVAFCPLSHRAPDDPIVHPNHFGASHLHDFLGNVSTSATSTAQTLLTAGTTCDPVTDRSAYWVPTLYLANGTPVAFDRVTIYYQTSVEPSSALQAYPIGLKVIAGDAKAAAPPNPSHFKWSCLGAANSSTTDFVICPPGSMLELLLNFPDCWNGVDLDSVDHKRHMAYSTGGKCPATHPVAVPLLQYKLRYATRGEAGMYLSSGAAYTIHGDFFNAWEPAAMENRMKCLRQEVKCGPEGLPGTVDPTPQPTVAPGPTSTPTATQVPPMYPPRARLPIVVKP